MAIPTKNKSSRTARTTASRHNIRGSSSHKAAVPMARQKDIPAGKYRSRIIKISFKKTMAGEDAVEIIYELTAPDGSIRKMREVMPYDSWAYERFCDALIAAGLEDGDDISDAVGVTEDVDLVYPDSHGLGHFAKRTPANDTVAEQVDEGKPSNIRSSIFDDEDDDEDDGDLDFELD